MQLQLPLSRLDVESGRWTSTLDVRPAADTTPELVFVRHPRARRYVISVRDDGTVRVTLPRWGSKREAARFAEQQHAWIARQRQRVEAAQRRRSTVDGVRDRELRRAEERLLREQAKRALPSRLHELAALHGVTAARVSVRNQKWRWGSCSPNGHVCLNWRLITMPESVRDYVIIHELMHLKRLDHSKKFWKLVAAACPQYQEARVWLRKHQLWYRCGERL